MIRFKIDQETEKLFDEVKSIYNFNKETIAVRIALAISLNHDKIFDLKDDSRISNGTKEFTPTSNVFGKIIDDTDNEVIYRAVFNQKYKVCLTDGDFVSLVKLHLFDGLERWIKDVRELQISKGGHIKALLKYIEKGLLNQKSYIRKLVVKLVQTRVLLVDVELMRF